jgi:predicted TIM-barrel fold metal-dependent hydrolase
MLVDVHAHIGSAARAAASAEDVARYAADGKFDAVLVSNWARGLDEVDANSACLAACRSQALLRPLYAVHVGQRDSNLNALRGAFELEPFVGAVFSPSETGFDAAAVQLAEYLAIVAKTGRPAVFCIGEGERSAPAKIYAQAKRQPKLPVVLSLCGTGRAQRAAVVDAVGSARRNGDARLYMDTSYATAAEVLTAVEVAGAERLLFGSDVFGQPDNDQNRVRALIDELRNTLPVEQFEMITEGNAAQLFRLSPPAG